MIANHENLIDSLSLPDFQNIINFLCSNGNGFDLSEPTFLKMLSCEKAEQLSQTISHVLDGLRSDAEKANESLIAKLVESLIEREQSYDEPVVAGRPEVAVQSSQPSSHEDSINSGQLDEKSLGSTKQPSTRRPSKAQKTKKRQPGKRAYDQKKGGLEDETYDSTSDSSSGGEKPKGKTQAKKPASSTDTDHWASSKRGKVKVTPPSSDDGSSTNSHCDSRLTDSESASEGRSEASSQRQSEKLTPDLINQGDVEESVSTGEKSSLSEDKESPKEAKRDSRQSKQSSNADDRLASKKGGKSQAKPPPASTDEPSADQSLDSSKSHSESTSLYWSDMSLDFESRNKIQMKKEIKLNFSLVLEEYLAPDSMAKINRMLEYLSHSHPEVRVSLSKSSNDQLPDLVIVCGSDHTFFKASLLYSDRVPILGLRAGNSQSSSLEFSLDDFAPEEVFDAIFSGNTLVVPTHRLICSWPSTNGPQQVCSINDQEQGVQLQPGATVKVSMTTSLVIKRPNSP